MHDANRDPIEAVVALLGGFPQVAVAVSGGVDSTTLAAVAAGHLGHRAEMFHAVSPAVPPDATRRLLDLARRRSWRLHLIDAAEFGDARYLQNPVNRCFFCKQSLYRAIAAATRAQIVSGTNADDLHDYRPGLDAAREARVRHPFAELGIEKAEIRRMARMLGLGTISELPGSPCLSSRVETGIAIDAETLRKIHASEMAIRGIVDASTIRCRVRREGVVVELDQGSLERLAAESRRRIVEAVRQQFGPSAIGTVISFSSYRTGSAFVGKRGGSPGR